MSIVSKSESESGEDSIVQQPKRTKKSQIRKVNPDASLQIVSDDENENLETPAQTRKNT